MNAGSRVFMDVSYTRTQRIPVGITRTVRRLEEELRRQCEAQGIPFSIVSFHTRGFRQSPTAALTVSGQRQPGEHDRQAAHLFRWIAGAAFHRAVLVALLLLPWGLLKRIWSSSSGRAFDFLSRSELDARFAPGDTLLLGDASWNYPVWIAAAKARAQGAKIVLLMYDLMPLRHPEFTFALVPRIFRLWLDRMLPIADAVVSISKATEDDLRRFARETKAVLPPCGHFRLGSDPVRVPPGDKPVRKQLEAFLRGAPTFAAIGSFEPKKNYGFLLEVFESLWSRGEDVRLLLIGRETAECEALVDRVRRHPQQGGQLMALFDANDAEVAHVYDTCRALVFPSLAEGFGLPLVEARTRGAAVIASDLPCFEELADAGVDLYAVDSAAALAAHVKTHARRSANAPRPPAMLKFTWADSAASLRGLCEELLLQPPAP